MIILDQTIVNVALPSIQDDLGFSAAGLAWVVNAYLIAFGGLLLLAGRLGDLIGRRTSSSPAWPSSRSPRCCAALVSPEMLIAARFVQGVGGALSSAVILGMIVTMFPEPREQAKAIGVFSFVASAGASIGLLAGGVLTEALDWHWIFFVNVPIGSPRWSSPARCSSPSPASACGAGADAPGRRARDRRADARRLHDRRRPLAPSALWPSRCWSRSSAARRPPSGRCCRSHPPLPQRRGRQPGADADGRRPARRLLPRRALPPARARLRRRRAPARPSSRSRSRSACSRSGSRRG